MFLMFGMCQKDFVDIKFFIGLMTIVAILKHLDMKLVGWNLGKSKWIVYKNPKNTWPFLVHLKRPRPKSFNLKINWTQRNHVIQISWKTLDLS